MNYSVIRCKDIRPNVSNVLERLRGEPDSLYPGNVTASVQDWIQQLSPIPFIPRSPLLPVTNPPASQLSANASRKRKLSPSPCPPDHCQLRRSTRLKRAMPTAVPTKAPRSKNNAQQIRRNTRANRKNGEQPSQADLTVEGTSGGIHQQPVLSENVVLALPNRLDQSRPPPPSRRSPSKSTTSRKGGLTVVKKEQLAFFNPPITFLNHRDLKAQGGLPDVTNRLWQNHVSSVVFCNQNIPSMFKNEVVAAFDTPLKSKGATPNTFDPSPYFRPAEHGLIWSTVFDVANQAEKYRDKVTESHWVAVVVSPLLQLIRKLEIFHNAEKQSLLEVLDLTAVEKSPRTLCPYSEDLFEDLDGKIDYAIGLDLSSSERFALERGQYTEGTSPSINQTASMANRTPIFINIEVKRRNTDRDPLIQLAAWIAAEFQKRLNEGYGLDQPALAIEIDGDLWQLYMVYPDKMNSGVGYRCNFVGPYGMGSTTTYEGIFKILTVLCSLAKWGIDHHRKWVETDILAKYTIPG